MNMIRMSRAGFPFVFHNGVCKFAAGSAAHLIYSHLFFIFAAIFTWIRNLSGPEKVRNRKGKGKGRASELEELLNHGAFNCMLQFFEFWEVPASVGTPIVHVKFLAFI